MTRIYAGHASACQFWTIYCTGLCLFQGVLLSLVFISPQTLERMPTICLFRLAFGRPCLGCGMTRALAYVMHGNLAAALASNRLVLVVLGLYALGLSAVLADYFQRSAIVRVRRG